ncbi:MAG: isochorismatase family protein [bacterium]|nr:isochorismatase family protein [bacterium]
MARAVGKGGTTQATTGRRTLIAARHPLTLVTRESRPIELTADNACLLLQDVHAPFADPAHGWLAQRVKQKVLTREFDEYIELLAIISENIPKVLGAARRLGMGVVYASLGYRDDDVSEFQRATGWLWDLNGEDGRYLPAWEPAGYELVLAKPGWSALSNPAFASYLVENRRTNVVVMGAMLDFGISQTCLELSDRGVGSLVVSDAVAALTRAGQDYVSGNLAHGLIKLRTTGEVLDLLDVMEKQGAVLI